MLFRSEMATKIIQPFTVQRPKINCRLGISLQKKKLIFLNENIGQCLDTNFQVSLRNRMRSARRLLAIQTPCCRGRTYKKKCSVYFAIIVATIASNKWLMKNQRQSKKKVEYCIRLWHAFYQPVVVREGHCVSETGVRLCYRKKNRVATFSMYVYFYSLRLSMSLFRLIQKRKNV